MSDDDPHRRRRRDGVADGTSLATKVVTAGVVAYGAYRLADWAWQTWWNSDQGNENNNYNEQTTTTRRQAAPSDSFLMNFFPPPPPTRQERRAKQARLARCQHECKQAWYALGSSAMFSVLEAATDITQATQRLKEIRRTTPLTSALQSEQAELWDLVKVRSVTRWIATAYAQALLMLVLTVQVNLWGAQLWREQRQLQASASAASSTQSSSMERMQSYRQEHEQVLQQTFGYFFSQGGMLDLCAAVEKATQQVLQDWNVLDKAYLHVPPAAMQQAITDIRHLVEEQSQRQRQRRSLWRFFVPPDNHHYNSNAVVVGECEILAETWDWLESPLLYAALDDVLAVTFDYGQEHCLPWSSSPSSSSLENNKDNLQPNENMSLAQILPKLKKCAAKFQSHDQNPLLQRVHQVQTVQEIGSVCFRELT